MKGEYKFAERSKSGIGQRGAGGFTLIELMITVAIIAILAAVAIPSYNQHVIKTKRTDGTGELERMRGLMERYYFDANTYTAALSDLPALSTDTIDSPEKHYKVSTKAATGACPISSCYELQAVPQGGQASDGTLTLSSTGRKTRDGSAGWD